MSIAPPATELLYEAKDCQVGGEARVKRKPYMNHTNQVAPFADPPYFTL
jgi:hypothetical protein